MNSKTCRGCAGTGISPNVSPREAQVATQTIYMVRPREEGMDAPAAAVLKALGNIDTAETQRHTHVVRAHARVDAWEGIGGVHKGRLAMSGPLLHVIEHVKQRLADGWQLEPGSMLPDKLLCPWCGGAGVTGHVLTTHTMAEAIELGGHDARASD